MIIIVVGLVLLMVSVGGAWVYKREANKPSWDAYTNDSLGVRLGYPSTFTKTTIDEKNKEAGIVLRIEKEKPKTLFSLRYEGDLGSLKMSGGTIFEAVVATVNRRYPDRFPDYKKESYEEFVLSKEKAARFDFTYTGVDGVTRMRQRFVIVVRDDVAYYLSCQTPEKEFFKSEKDFERIINSFEFVD